MSGFGTPISGSRAEIDGHFGLLQHSGRICQKLKDIQKLLESQKLTLGDVVMMHVYLGGDPAKDGKMDFAGMMAGYSQFFGTKDQPNKPARTTVQVVLPARGALVEIDLIAVRPK